MLDASGVDRNPAPFYGDLRADDVPDQVEHRADVPDLRNPVKNDGFGR